MSLIGGQIIRKIALWNGEPRWVDDMYPDVLDIVRAEANRLAKLWGM
jgi:hypothetical protein